MQDSGAPDTDSSSSSSSTTIGGNAQMPLHLEFQKLYEAFQKIESGDAGSGLEETKAIIVAILGFQKLESRVREAALFSRDETLEDIDTFSLKYLLIPYYLGMLTLKKTDMRDRVQNLNRAQAFLSNFMLALEKHHMLTSEDRNVFHREKPLAAGAKRAEKITRANEETQLRKKIEELFKRKESKGEEEEEGRVDEEVERSLWLSQIRRAVLKTLDELDSISQELPLAEHMAKMQQMRIEDRPPPRRQEENKLVPEGQGTVLHSTRLHQEDVKKTMFREHWIQPTYTVEEAGAIEMRHAVRSAPPEKEKKKKRNEESEDEESESDEDSDDWVRKKREDDEFKDDHPAGWGNRINQG